MFCVLREHSQLTAPAGWSCDLTATGETKETAGACSIAPLLQSSRATEVQRSTGWSTRARAANGAAEMQATEEQL
eukprot:1926777-Prymnesium_polylepis.1